MRITLVAGDHTQSMELTTIGEELHAKGHETHEFYGRGAEAINTKEMKRQIDGSSILIIAVSNRFEETEEAIQFAKAHWVPVVLFAGSQPGCFRGSNLEPYRDDFNLVLVFNDLEIEEARSLFSKATVTMAGSSHWEKFFFPELSRDEARKTLEVEPNEKLILLTGDTDSTFNILFFAMVLEAIHEFSSHICRCMKIRVVIGLHPGDPTPPKAYADLVKYSGLSTIFTRGKPLASDAPLGIDLRVIPTPRILPGIDLVLTSVSTLGFEAACQRIPVICFLPLYMQKWLLENRGSDQWEQCQNGTAFEVRGCCWSDLPLAINHLLKDISKKIQERQVDVYPASPEEGTAVRRAVEAVESFWQDKPSKNNLQ